MNDQELFQKNQTLSTEFDLYLHEHPELLDQIPDNSLIVLLPEFDKELKKKNMEMAKKEIKRGQPVVYVTLKKLRESRLEGLKLEVA